MQAPLLPDALSSFHSSQQRLPLNTLEYSHLDLTPWQTVQTAGSGWVTFPEHTGMCYILC